jgi:hypothetical protein
VKTQLLLSLVLAGSVVASSAFAEEQQANNDQSSNTSTIKMTDVQKKDEKVGDLDEEITNAKMRAESGSKSQWSMSFELNYSGGNLVDPLGSKRPNYSGIASQEGTTSLAGDISASLRLNKNNRLSLGTGVSVRDPLHSTASEVSTPASSGGASDISTPFIQWGHTARIAGQQNSFSLGYSHATKAYYTDVVKSVGDISASHVIIFDIAGSGWQPGFSTSLYYSLFKDGANASDVVGNDDRRQDYGFGFYPFVEYSFNDKYSFRTVFRPFDFSHNRSDAAGTFERSLYTQSVGVGIAVTRDLYLYPNMQFAPENLSQDVTNVGMSVTANLF